MLVFGRKQHRPTSLYKYVTAARWDLVQALQIRFTQFADLNDPFETSAIRSSRTVHDLDWYYHNIVRPPGSYGGYSPGVGWTPDRLQELDINATKSERARDEYIDVSLKHLGILCLSERPDDLLMWAHYAENHFGFVIEFDTEHEFFWHTGGHPNWSRQHETLFELRPVKYQKTVPHLRPEKPEKALESVVFTKSIHWNYEREWRLVRPLAEAHNVIQSRSTQIYLFSIVPALIRGIRFGCRIPIKQVQEYMRTLFSDERYQHVIFYSTVLDKTAFQVRFEMLRREDLVESH